MRSLLLTASVLLTTLCSTHAAQISQSEYEYTYKQTQKTAALITTTLERELSNDLRETLLDQVALLKRLTPHFFQTLTKKKAQQMSGALNLITDRLTAHTTTEALPLSTLTQIRLTNGMILALLQAKILRSTGISSATLTSVGVATVGIAALVATLCWKRRAKQAPIKPPHAGMGSNITQSTDVVALLRG